MNRYIQTDNGLIDTHTGEVLDLNDILRARLEKHKEELIETAEIAKEAGTSFHYRFSTGELKSSNNVSIKKKGNYHFNKVFVEDMNFLFEYFEVSVYALAFISRFSSCITFPDNQLVIKNKIPTVQDLADIMGLKSRMKMQEILNELEALTVIKRVKEGKQKAIYFNPFLICKAVVSAKTYMLFKDTIFDPKNIC